MKRRSYLRWTGAAGVAWAVGGMQAVQANSFEDFHRAIIRDNPVLLRNVLQRGLDPNTVNERGRPGIIQALHLESMRAVHVLVNARGFKPNLASTEGETPLMMAAIKGELELVRRLIAMGAEVNRKGWTPLHYAASSDREHSVEIAALLLEHHAYIDAESPNKSTPLMLAAQYGSQNMVQLLLNEGADVTLRNQLGLTAIDFARRSDRDYMVRMMTQAMQQARKPAPAPRAMPAQKPSAPSVPAWPIQPPAAPTTYKSW